MNDLQEILSKYDISIAVQYSLTTGQTIEYLFKPKIPFVYKDKNIPVEIYWTREETVVKSNQDYISVYINNNTFYHINYRTVRHSHNETDKYLSMSFEEQVLETAIKLYQVLKKYDFDIPKELL